MKFTQLLLAGRDPYLLSCTVLKIGFIFIDGIGFGQETNDNPFFLHGGPILRRLANARAYPSNWYAAQNSVSPRRFRHREANWTLCSIDPSSGVRGLPQSGSGHTSLFTGVDAPRVLNRHVPNFPSFTLKKFIRRYSLIRVLAEAGHPATLLNCYSPYYLEKMVRAGSRMLSASTLTQLASGQELLSFENLAAGEGLFMDITWQLLNQMYGNPDSPYRQGNWTGIGDGIFGQRQDARAQGTLFAQLARRHHFSLFEYFLTDKVGHDRNHEYAANIVRTLEEFLQAAIDELAPDELLIMSSDHGNFEDLSVKTHTHNAVPLLVAGKAAQEFAERVEILADIPRQILRALGLDAEHLTEAHFSVPTEEISGEPEINAAEPPDAGDYGMQF